MRQIRHSDGVCGATPLQALIGGRRIAARLGTACFSTAQGSTRSTARARFQNLPCQSATRLRRLSSARHCEGTQCPRQSQTWSPCKNCFFLMQGIASSLSLLAMTSPSVSLRASNASAAIQNMEPVQSNDGESNTQKKIRAKISFGFFPISRTYLSIN